MTTMTINPQNWIDNAVEITVEGNTVTVRGETLELVQQVPILEEKVEWDFHAIDVVWGEIKLCTLHRFGDDKAWQSSKFGIEHDYHNPHILAAIMACNLI